MNGTDEITNTRDVAAELGPAPPSGIRCGRCGCRARAADCRCGCHAYWCDCHGFHREACEGAP
jgi:hypothetical protein